MTTLLRLPVEIRAMVWAYALHPFCTNHYRAHKVKRRAARANKAVVNLMLICHTFYTEILSTVANVAEVRLMVQFPHHIDHLPPDTTSVSLLCVPPVLRRAKHVRGWWYRDHSREVDSIYWSGKREPSIPIAVVRRRLFPWKRVIMSVVLVSQPLPHDPRQKQAYSLSQFEADLQSLESDMHEAREYARGHVDGVDVAILLCVRRLLRGDVLKAYLRDGKVSLEGGKLIQDFATKREVLDTIARTFGLETTMQEGEEGTRP